MDEILLNELRPICLNGIENFVGRPDLGERSIITTLEPIADNPRGLAIRPLFQQELRK